MEMTGKSLTKMAPGCYRVPLDFATFAQIVKGRYTSSKKWGENFERDSISGRHWCIQIRDKTSGALIRYAGIFSTLKEALDSLI